MRLTLFGATGRAGRHLLEQAISAGHHVTVLVRDPRKLGLKHERLVVVEGGIGNPASVEQAVIGAEAVLSVLGPTTNEPVFAVSGGMDHILAAMRKHNVPRLVVSIGAGVRDPNDVPGLFDKLINVLIRAVSRNVYEDMAQTAVKVRVSDLDWTIVRVPMLTDDPATGRVRAGYVGPEVGFRLSRADLAAFMLAQVTDTQYLRLAPAISN